MAGVLQLNGTTVATESSGSVTLASAVKYPAGHIIQIRSITITTASYDNSATGYNSTSTSTTWLDVQTESEVLSHTITPQTGNHVYVRAAVCIGAEAGYQWNVRLVRGSTPICVADDSGAKASATFGYRFEGDQEKKITWPVDFLDTSPGGDGSAEITYKFQWQMENGGRILLNNSYNDSDSYTRGRGVSTITLMEIQA